MRAVVVGAGASARELIRRLGDSWSVTVIDPDPDRLRLAEKIRDVETVEGDGSSVVVLRDAGIDHAVTVVAATGSDDVNIEVAKLAREAGVDHVVAVVRLPERIDEVRAVGAEPVTPASLAGRDMEIAMEPRKLTSTTFAHGRAEAIEFEIASDSPVQGRALKDLHSESWVVAAILRDGELVVPHGATRLLTGDMVTIVGAASNFPDRADLCRGSIEVPPQLRRQSRRSPSLGSRPRHGDRRSCVLRPQLERGLACRCSPRPEDDQERG